MAANPQQQIQAALVPAALPQEIVPVTTKNRQVQYTLYDPQSVAAYREAMGKAAPRASTAELLANALAGIGDTPSYEGAYGTQTINPIVSGISNAIRSGAGIYGARAENERAKQADQIATEQALAQLDMENGVQNVTDTSAVDYIKVNKDTSGAGLAEKYSPENIVHLKELNNKAGRWANDWLKGLSDITNTEQSQAYNEFEGLAKQYVQDQLRKIYGAQFTESEGERFFQSMGLSPKLDPDVRWRLVENALTDVARKNGLQMPTINKNGANTNDLINQFMNGTI